MALALPLPIPGSLATVATVVRSKLFRNLGAMAGAELCNRVSRIVTAVALANTLSPFEFGLAAIAITASELVRVLTSTGLESRILQCSDEDLEKVSRASYQLNWMLYIGVFAFQLGSAFPLGAYYGDARICWLVAGLALPYLLLPFAAVQVYRLQREQRMALTATMLVVLLTGDNLLTAAMALSGCGLFSLVVPKAVMALVWVVTYRWKCPWRAVGAVDRDYLRSTFRFGVIVLATEITNVLRLHGDKLVIGQVLGIEQLGIYFFAFNSGLGIIASVINALGLALRPHFCRNVAEDWRLRDYWQPALTVCLLTAPLIALQAGLAPYYVPVVFGTRWNEAVPLLMMLCVSGIGVALWRPLTQFVRSRNRAVFELALTVLYTAITLGAVVATAPFGLNAVAASLMITSLVATPLFVIGALAHLRNHDRQERTP